MKGIRNLLIGGVLGGAMGWALGYLRLPGMTNGRAFWVGFLACGAILLFLVALFWLGRKNASLFRIHTGSSSRAAALTYGFVWFLVAVLVGGGVLASSYLIHRQDDRFQAQLRAQNDKIQEQTALMESIRGNNEVFYLHYILDRVEDELRDREDGSLSASTISRVADITNSFPPYRYFRGDTLTDLMLSPERGKLLQELAKMELDSLSFASIKSQASFTGADLQGVDLRGADLSGVDLKGARLRDAQLDSTNFRGGDLSGADLWGAHLVGADLSQTTMRRTEFSWADLQGANLNQAYMDGIVFNHAELVGADLSACKMQWAHLEGTMLNRADLTGADILGSEFIQANLSQANLTATNLMGSIFDEARMEGTVLEHASVDTEEWVNLATEKKIVGATALQAAYQVEPDTVVRFQYSNFTLERK